MSRKGSISPHSTTCIKSIAERGEARSHKFDKVGHINAGHSYGDNREIYDLETHHEYFDNRIRLHNIWLNFCLDGEITIDNRPFTRKRRTLIFVLSTVGHPMTTSTTSKMRLSPDNAACMKSADWRSRPLSDVALVSRSFLNLTIVRGTGCPLQWNE